MSNKLKLQDHTTDLQSILDTINALPEAGADAYAVIAVNYPEGGVCTCSNDSEMLELDNTVGYGFFLVPEDGKWTVTSTDKVDSTKTKSVEIEITKEGQFESVILNYALMLFDNGEVVDWTSRSAKPTASVGETLYVYVNTEDRCSTITTAEMLNVSEYDTLHFVIDAIEGAKNDRHFIGLSTNTTPIDGMGNVKSSAVAYITNVVTGENVIDISDVTDGSYYVCISQAGTESNPRGMRASKVWLE